MEIQKRIETWVQKCTSQTILYHSNNLFERDYKYHDSFHWYHMIFIMADCSGCAACDDVPFFMIHHGPY